MESPSVIWKAHHVLISAVLAIVLLGSAVYGIDSIIERHDARNDAKWQALLTQSEARTTLIQTKLTQDETQWVQQNAQSAALIASLASTISKRDSQLKVVQTANASLSAQDAALKLATQTGASVSDVTAVGDNVTLSLPVTRKVVNALDELPIVKADLIDTTTQLDEAQSINTRLSANVGEQKQLVTALQDQLVTADKACKADIALVNAKARKSKLKWFGAGLIVGFIGRGFAGF